MTWSVSYVLFYYQFVLCYHHQDPVVAMPGGVVCASVMEYELMLNDAKSTMLPSQCMSGQCRYNTTETFDTASVNVVLMAVGLNAEESKIICKQMS